ncbi:hypothetical protein GF327_07025 [Candidatus Woesearchaeota archaeon]|nr:hypothetical protein [Candidatus Woesearchaeota archaeon]
MKKRGLFQLDWALSFAIFILFIAWFFVFLGPQLTNSSNKNSLITIVKTNFFQEFEYEEEKIPLFIRSQNIGKYIPIHLNASIRWNKFAFSNSQQFIKNKNNIIFLPEINKSPEIFWIVKNKNSTFENTGTDLISTSDWTTTTDFKAYFTDSILTKAEYKGILKINDYKTYIGTEEFNPTLNSHENLGLASKYLSETQGFNNTYYIYAYNSIIHNYIQNNNPNENYTYRIEFDLKNYTAFYSDNSNFQNLTDSKELKTISYNKDYVTLYNSNDSLSIFFSENTTITLEYFNNSRMIKAELLLTDSLFIKFVFHPGNYSNITSRDYEYDFGIKQKIKAINLEEIQSANYESLKSEWQYPELNDFKISIYNSTKTISLKDSIASIGKSPGKNIQVFAKEYNTYIKKDSQIHPAVVNIRVW